MERTRTWWVRLAPVVVALAAVAIAWKGAVRLADGEWAMAGVAGLVLGVFARMLRAHGRDRLALVPPLIVAVAATVVAVEAIAPLVIRHCFAEGRWYAGLGVVLVLGASTVVALVSLSLRRGAAVFAVAMGLVSVLGFDESIPGVLMVVSYLFARDTGVANHTIPARQTIALAGAGALSVLIAHAVAFDAFVGLASVDGAEYITLRLYVDDPIVRWPRIALEVFAVAACFAHARGKTWGVLGLIASGIAFVVLLTIGDLPAWSSGCLGHSHPIERDAALLFGALFLALAPWVRPLARFASRT